MLKTPHVDFYFIQSKNMKFPYLMKLRHISAFYSTAVGIFLAQLSACGSGA